MIFDVLLIYNFLFLLPTVHILVNGMNQGISAVIIQVRRKTTAEFVETSVTNSSLPKDYSHPDIHIKYS